MSAQIIQKTIETSAETFDDVKYLVQNLIRGLGEWLISLNIGFSLASDRTSAETSGTSFYVLRHADTGKLIMLYMNNWNNGSVANSNLYSSVVSSDSAVQNGVFSFAVNTSSHGRDYFRRINVTMIIQDAHNFIFAPTAYNAPGISANGLIAWETEDSGGNVANVFGRIGQYAFAQFLGDTVGTQTITLRTSGSPFASIDANDALIYQEAVLDEVSSTWSGARMRYIYHVVGCGIVAGNKYEIGGKLYLALTSQLVIEIQQ